MENAWITVRRLERWSNSNRKGGHGIREILAKRLQAAQEKLEDLLNEYGKFLNPERARLEADEYRGGSLMPTIYADDMRTFTLARA